MWGGVKKRTQYGDVFRRWSASQGLEAVRKTLFKEPRPWYLAYSLHQYRHLLQDHHCARLLAWSASVVELQPTLARKKDAYRYSQEMFQMLVRQHKVGRESLNEYMRLCAVGKDLTSAYDWFQYWQEAQLDDFDALHTLTWLLQIALLSPNDERVADLALTVLELYRHRHAPHHHSADTHDEAQATPTLSRSAPASDTTSPESQEELRRFLLFFKLLEPRVRSCKQVIDFLKSVSITLEEAASTGAALGWPVESAHRYFPQLEQHIDVAAGCGAKQSSHVNGGTAETRSLPKSFAGVTLFGDSILHPQFLKKLQKAAALHRVPEVVQLVEMYEEGVRQERARMNSGRSTTPPKLKPDGELWRGYADPTAAAFRKRLVEEGGATPELYHYIITALVVTQPSAALCTLRRMESAQLRPLDLTRTAVLLAVHDSPEEERQLFREQLEKIRQRVQLDADYDTVKVVEAYWKYDYVDFFHYRNSLTQSEFYEILLTRLGPRHVQQLLLDTQVHGSTASADDLVLLDDNLRTAMFRYYRSQVGASAVQRALDDISTQTPKLDVGLVGTLPHFENYCMDRNDTVALSEKALQTMLQPYSIIYVLDTSFIETSESFLTVGASPTSLVASDPSGTTPAESIVLVPYMCLSQLGASVINADRFVTFDPALQEMMQAEPFLASQRLRSLFALVMHPAPAVSAAHTRRARVLHFSECLCANQIEPRTLQSLGLSPASSDNDQLLLVLAMLSSLKPPHARLILCADDEQLLDRFRLLQPSSLFSSAVEVMTTAPPASIDLDNDLINDNPVWIETEDAVSLEPRLGLAAEVAAAADSSLLPSPHTIMSPVHQTPADVEQRSLHTGLNNVCAKAAQATSNVSLKATISDDAMGSPWLALLAEEDDTSDGGSVVSTSDASTAVEASPPSPVVVSMPGSSRTSTDREYLMQLYETPFDVVPVGVKMEAASALGSIYAEFDSLAPEQREAREADRAAQRSLLSPEDDQAGGNGKGRSRRRHRRSTLEKEMLANRGTSNRERFRMARALSNRSGGRVPFNLRYRVVEANVRDPRNASLYLAYAAQIAKTRAIYKKRHP